MKTIKELADELGCSKTAIRKYMDEDFRITYTARAANGVIVITPEGCKLIAESLRKPLETTGNQFAETTGNQGLQAEVEFLREQLRAKDRQIEAQQQQISSLTASLDHTTAALQEAQASVQAAQALHAGTIKTQMLPDGERRSLRDWFRDVFKG